MDLLLSLDYEIFGNGAGDVMRDVIRPTDRLLRLCDKHGARLTIMFEVGEYCAFVQYDRQLRKDLGYSPAEKMKQQALEAIERGHDVQLHLHPQWIGAEYSDRAWRLRNLYWRLADLPDGLGDRDRVTSVTGALCWGRRTIEDMIRPRKRDYECVCFRAGGYYAQPSRDIIQGMKTAGLWADSSVIKGYETTVPFAVDYSHMQTDKAVWWTANNDLTIEGKPGENVIELPVSSRMEPYWKSFKKANLRAAWTRRCLERASRGHYATDRRISSVPGYRTVLMRLLQKRASTFDFCKLSSTNMLKRMEEHAKSSRQPIVVIGHSKDFVNDHEFDRFLASLRCRDGVCLPTMSDYVQQTLCVLTVSGSSATGCGGPGPSGAR
jgi:hypothetical protein